MDAPARQILTATQLRQKIRRIAFQIYENNFEESVVVLAGVTGEGMTFARLLTDDLRQIAPLTVDLLEIRLDKKTAIQPPVVLPAADLSGKVVIVADDVLYTGRTLMLALQPFLSASVQKLQVAVLVDRNHPRYPVAADYKGYELSTTLTEHVEVILSDDSRAGVYLR
jgi:pyrimidine operon attenuation protein / uracil phosphoribosyltransferase